MLTPLLSPAMAVSLGAGDNVTGQLGIGHIGGAQRHLPHAAANARAWHARQLSIVCALGLWHNGGLY